MSKTLSPDEFRELYPNASVSCQSANLKQWAIEQREQRERNPEPSEACPSPIDSAGQVLDQPEDPEPEFDPRHAAEEAHQAEKENSGRYLIRLTSFRTRLCDEDNLTGKFHTDSFRYCGWLPEDAPGVCKIQIAQVKVQTKDEEGTYAEIFPPGTW